MTAEGAPAGMTSTIFRNGHGLPNAARSLYRARHGHARHSASRALPRYYSCFSTRSFGIRRAAPRQPRPAARPHRGRRRHQDRLSPRLGLNETSFRPCPTATVASSRSSSAATAKSRAHGRADPHMAARRRRSSAAAAIWSPRQPKDTAIRRSARSQRCCYRQERAEAGSSPGRRSDGACRNRRGRRGRESIATGGDAPAGASIEQAYAGLSRPAWPTSTRSTPPRCRKRAGVVQVASSPTKSRHAALLAPDAMKAGDALADASPYTVTFDKMA